MNKIISNNYNKFHSTTTHQSKLINEKNFTYRIFLNVLNKYITTNEKVLDIGCGAGTLALYLASKGNMVTGVDISPKAIRACEKSAKQLDLSDKVSFQVMNFPYEIPQGKFSRVICMEVIEHLKEDRLALRKVFNSLNSGGIAIISTPSQNAPLYKLGFAKDFDRRVGHLRRYKLEELAQMCQDVGFEILETKKTEGIIRNFLFLNPIAGKFVRFVKFQLVNLVSGFDDISCRVFGESDLFIILRKP